MSNIKYWRKQADLTQQELSDLIGELPIRTIQEWEGERRTPPNYVENLIIDKIKTYINNKKKGAED